MCIGYFLIEWLEYLRKFSFFFIHGMYLKWLHKWYIWCKINFANSNKPFDTFIEGDKYVSN